MNKSTQPNEPLSKSWYVASAILLAVYLGFFHSLVVAKPEQVQMFGAGFSVIWMFVCFLFQSSFRNRFEFGIHMLLVVDFVLESLVPVHDGYGFYFCALAFWSVFWVYHHWNLFGSRANNAANQGFGSQSMPDTVEG